jgi:SAM-dependent methyltransferase
MLQEVQSYWDNCPCDSARSSAQPGTLEYFQELERLKYELEPHIPVFAGFNAWRGKRVLEVGCGMGTDTCSFARAGAKVTAVDLSPASLEITRKRLVLQGLKANLYQANAEELTRVVPVDAYDLVYSYGVIHHTPNPVQAFSELKWYCGPRTELRIMLYAKWSARTLVKLFTKGHGAFWRFSELARLHAEYQYGCPVAFHYSFQGVRELMADYQITDMRKAYIKPGVLPGPITTALARYFGSEILIKAKRRC